jgi:hypothetical protein
MFLCLLITLVSQLIVTLFFHLEAERRLFFTFWRYSPNLGLGLPPWNSRFHFGLIGLRHSVGLLGWVISSSQGLHLYINTEKHSHTHTNTKHPCPEWDSNPRSRFLSERRVFTLDRSGTVTGKRRLTWVKVSINKLKKSKFTNTYESNAINI